MAPGSVPPTSSCPLLKLLPHLRLRIYAYTHQLSPDLDIDEDGCEDLSKAWESTPLVKLASTCRLIADEARHYFRSLPTTTTLRRMALVELLPSGGPRSYVKLRLVHLPCPTIDLTHFTATYDFAKYRSTAHGFPLADHDDALEATRKMGFHVSSALRSFMSLINATELMRCILLIGGLGPRKDGEPYFDAMQRILYQPNAGPASAETLAQEIFSCCCEDAAMLRVTSNLRLPIFEGCLILHSSCLLYAGRLQGMQQYDGATRCLFLARRGWKMAITGTLWPFVVFLVLFTFNHVLRPMLSAQSDGPSTRPSCR